MNSIPDNWATSLLEECGEWGSGGTPKKSNPLYYDNGTIPWLIIGDLNDGFVKKASTYITPLGLRNSSAKLLPVNTLLIAMYGSIGKLGITSFECATNQAIAFCKPNAELIQLKYLFYSLMNARNDLISYGKGGAQQNISQTILKAFQIPLAPLNEQKRIADKLDSLLEHVKSCQNHLSRFSELLKKFRQEVLTSATSGELTKDWRLRTESNKNINDLIPITDYGDRPLQKLPNSWEWYKFSDIATIESNLVDPNEYKDYPHIAPNYIESQTGRLLPYGTIASDEIISSNHLFRPGQIIYSKIRPYLCKAVLVDFYGLCSADMYPISGKLVTSEFLHKWMISRQFTFFASSKQERTVLPKINQKALNDIPVPVPPYQEQVEIVHRLNAIFAYADKLETYYRNAKSIIDSITNVLIKKAYCGELETQDPKDEPAINLLQRIRTSQNNSDQQSRFHPHMMDLKEAKMPKLTLEDVILNISNDSFSFDELYELFPGDYEIIKDTIFGLLSEKDPIIKQVFDPNFKEIRFERCTK